MPVWGIVLFVFLGLYFAVDQWQKFKMRSDVLSLRWRLDSIWKKVQHWHTKVDKVSGEVRRMTGEQVEIKDIEDAEEYDDVDRKADTQPRVEPPKKKRSRKGSK